MCISVKATGAIERVTVKQVVGEQVAVEQVHPE
jgi:hypothetical protein